MEVVRPSYIQKASPLGTGWKWKRRKASRYQGGGWRRQRDIQARSLTEKRGNPTTFKFQPSPCHSKTRIKDGRGGERGRYAFRTIEKCRVPNDCMMMMAVVSVMIVMMMVMRRRRRNDDTRYG